MLSIAVFQPRDGRMATFNFWTFCIDLTDRGDRDRLVASPMHPAIIASFAHEYVHYLQSVSSLLGFNIVEQVIRVGLDGALRLTGHTNSSRNLSLDDMLDSLKQNAGTHDAEIASDCQSLIDELACYMSVDDYPYESIGQPWDVVCGSVAYGTFRDEEVYGYLTERSTFRPFFPRLLTEGVARQGDRWFARNHGMEGQFWEMDNIEVEVYLGIRNILLNPRYERCVHPGNIEELVVIICTIALLTPHPDWSVMKMLETIAHEKYWMPIADWDRVLRKLMFDNGELGVGYFNEVMDRILHGPALAISRRDFLPIFEHLKIIHSASLAALRGSFFLFDRNLNWDGLWQTVLRYQVPPIRVSDGIVSGFNGAICNGPLHRLIFDLHAKVFPAH